MRKNAYPILFFLFLAVIFLLPLGTRELFSPDEDRYAEIAREMIQTGDYVTPRLNGVLYFEKPVLGYWLIAGAQLLFGENAFAARLPSMLSMLLCAVLLFHLARERQPDRPFFPYLTAGIFLCIPLVFVLGSMAILDPAFTLFLTLGMYFFYQAVRDREHLWTKRTILFQILCGAAFGGAFLTKGFLAFALPGGAIFVYMLLPEHKGCWKERSWLLARLRELLALPWIPLLTMLAVVLPWSLAIHHAQPQFWNYFFWEEHVKRFAEHQQHPQPFWFFIPVLLGGLAFFVPLIWPAVCGLRRNWKESSLIRYLLCWAFVPFLLLSLSSGKLGTYILPCYPPLALLLAIGLYRHTVEENRMTFLRYFLQIFGRILLIGGCGFFLYHLIVPDAYCLYGKKELLFPLLPLFFCVLFAGMLFLRAAKKTCPPLRCWALSGLALVPLLCIWHTSIPKMILKRKAPQPLLREMVRRFGTDVELFSDNYPFQAVCWAFRSADVTMLLREGELEKGIRFSGDHHRLFSQEQFLARLKDPARKRPILVVMPTNCARDYLADWLPEPKQRFSENLKDERTYTVLQY